MVERKVYTEEFQCMVGMSLFSMLPKGTWISYEKVPNFALFCCFTKIQGIKKSLKTY